jgi:lipopolysaccharide assembly outer membrane protein LptD (OstA)
MLTTLFKKSLILFFVFLSGYLLSTEIDISADELSYRKNQLIIASGNVELYYKQITLNAKYAEIDTKTNEFYAIGGIDVTYQGHRFYTDVVQYKLVKDQLTFSAFSATLNPVELETPLYFSSKVINKEGNYFYGTEASFSTCPYDKQYYVVEAKRFKFYPNDKIIGYDVVCRSGVVPVFYSPYYEFKLGYMNPILLFPIIGSNLVEGDYVKTALDYYYDEDFSTLIYLDHLEKLGWGFGFNATIRKNQRDPSTAYFYYINSERYALKWDQSINLPDVSYKYGFQQRNMHRNSGGFDKFTEGYVNYLNKDVGDIYVYNKDNKAYSQKTEKYTWRGNIGETMNNLQLGKENYYNIGAARQNINLATSMKGINNNFSYSSNLYGNRDNYQYYNNNLNLSPLDNLQLNANVSYKSDQVSGENDELLMPKFSINYNLFNAPLNLRAVSLRTDMLLDLDGDRVTKDDKISILESLPEADFSFNPLNSGIFRYTPRVIVGNYHERRFRETYGNREVFYKRVLLKNDINADLFKSDLANFNIAYGYDQYLYETQDKQYGLNEAYQLDLLNGQPFRNSSRYVQYHNRGYTPFYFDEMSSYESKRLTNVFTYQITSKTNLSISDGYDFINKQRDLQYFDLKHLLDKQNSVTIFTGYDYENARWQNLQSNITLQEDTDNYLIWRMNYEITSGRVRDSRIQVGKSLGEDAPWKIRSELVWNYYYERYSVPFIDVIRDLGCVEIIYRYREYNKEHTFLFRVNAFPDETFGTTIGDAGTTIHGWEQRDVSR